MPDHTSKPGHFCGYWLEQKPGRESGIWYRTWYDRSIRQNRRVSTGERDFQAAQRSLVAWVLENERPRNAARDAVTVDAVCLRYWSDHASNIASAKTANRELGIIQEWWEGKSVAEITPDAQRKFRRHLSDAGTGPGGIDRILATFRAALNHARKNEEIESVPFISGFRSTEELRSREPKGRPLNLDELASLVATCESRHMLMYIIIAIGTLARPGAILDMTSRQYDAAHGILNLNPPARAQNKKWRPTIPVARALTPWLAPPAAADGRYVTYRGQPITCILAAFRRLRESAGLDKLVTPYSIRHTMAREMRKARVPGEEISLFLGHLPHGAAATTAVYAPYDPGYLAAAADVINRIMIDVGAPARLPAIQGSGAPISGKALRGGIGEAKRDEVRRLILAGVPHAEIVRQTGVSGGTVSGIRQALRAAMGILKA